MMFRCKLIFLTSKMHFSRVIGRVLLIPFTQCYKFLEYLHVLYSHEISVIEWLSSFSFFLFNSHSRFVLSVDWIRLSISPSIHSCSRSYSIFNNSKIKQQIFSDFNWMVTMFIPFLTTLNFDWIELSDDGCNWTSESITINKQTNEKNMKRNFRIP